MRRLVCREGLASWLQTCQVQAATARTAAAMAPSAAANMTKRRFCMAVTGFVVMEPMAHKDRSETGGVASPVTPPQRSRRLCLLDAGRIRRHPVGVLDCAPQLLGVGL